jgi:hypothetical protein
MHKKLLLDNEVEKINIDPLSFKINIFKRSYNENGENILINKG